MTLAWLGALAIGLSLGLLGSGGSILTVHLAIGTSLVIITLKSLTGFAKYVDVLDRLGLALDWPVLLLIAAVGIAGSVAGRTLGRRLSQDRLRRAFALFLVAIGAWILWRSAPTLF
jgi:hypothetical protein